MKSFLDALYGDLPDGAWFYLWVLSPQGDKRTEWFQDTEQAASRAASLHGVNVYYPIAWATEPGDSFHRLERSQTAGIVGLVSDLDFKADNKPRGFPGEDEALDAISRMPLRPSACIHSGHGLQCAWLFREPLCFDLPRHRDEAQYLSTGWGYSLAHIINRMGYEVDAVHDITRVMRLPGSVNYKNPAHAEPVAIRWFDDNCRYNPEDFEPYLSDVPAAAIRTPLPDIDLSTDFPLDKHDAALANDPEYAAIYRHERRFPSCSEYDMALASKAVLADWSDNEIAALISQNQRRYGNKPGKDRDAKYIARTIANARKGYTQYHAETEASAVLVDDTTDREAKIRALADKWQIPLTDIELVTGDPSIFRFWIGGQCAQIPATKMVNQQTFIGEVISACRRYPRPIGNKEKPGWPDLVNIVGEVAEVIEAGTEATKDGALSSLLREFLEERGVAELADIDERQIMATPFRNDGFTWFRLGDVMTYAKMHDNEHMGRREFAQRLRAMGGKLQRFHARTMRGNARTTLSFYGLPSSVLVEEPAGDPSG